MRGIPRHEAPLVDETTMERLTNTHSLASRNKAWTSFLAGAGVVTVALLFVTPEMQFARRADAGPPPTSALSVQQNEASQKMIDALDSGKQRAELVGELKAMREELSALRALMTGGKMKTSVSNFDEMPLEKVKLEIDYSKLAAAMQSVAKSE